MGEPEAQKARRGGVGALALMAFFAVAPAAATAGGLAIAPLQALAGAFGAPWRSLHRQSAAGWGLLALLIAFPLYLAVTTLWSPAPGSLQPYRLLGGLLCGWLFCQAAGHDAVSQRRVRAAGAAAVFMLIAGIGGWLVSAPWATPFLLSASGLEQQMPDSWQARGVIWRNICDMIYEHPLLGRGIDASRFFTDIVFVRDGLGFPAIPLHPHSASLQIWFEGGAVGVGIVAAILIAIGLVAQRAFAEHRAAGAALCAGMGAVGVFANVSFGAWQEWWVAAIFCAPALALAARR